MIKGITMMRGTLGSLRVEDEHNTKQSFLLPLLVLVFLVLDFIHDQHSWVDGSEL